MILPERGDSPQTIPQVMERYRMSERIALVCGDERVTYRELIADAQRIASGLISAGIQKGDRVVLSMDRGIGYVKAWLGVLYAGAAQISFHRGWPKNLVSLAAEECRPLCSIDEASCRRLLTSPLLPELEERLGSLKGSDLFQIIYTSGSTGKPKGVINSHLTAVSQTLAAEESCLPGYFVQHCRRMLLDCSPGFVLSSYCLCVCLLNERTVILAGKEEARTPRALAECAQRHRADTVHVTPSWFLQNRDEPAFARMVKSTKLLLCGGEVVSPVAARIITKAAGGEVIFCYGASELFGPYLFSFGSAFDGREVSFLLPEAGAAAFVLDDQGQMVKPGEQGEVCVGGIPAALGGYYNDFALTKQRFRTDPKFGRLYMTGDRARMNDDGRICFLGRSDLMVKVFGMRVELEAIERAMMETEGVSLAAARVLGEGNEARIWAWYSGAGNMRERELRRCLSQKLPSYMVPTRLVAVEELPLNASGKLDRGALPVIEGTGQPQKVGKGALSARKAPDPVREETVCRCFQEALRMDRPALRQENFFLLGGDSISALALIDHLEQEGFACDLNDVFRNPTPSSLSRILRTEKTEENPESATFRGRIPEELLGCSADQNVEALFPVCNSTLTYLLMDDYGIAWRKNILRIEVILSHSFSEEEFRDRVRCLTQNHPALRSRFIRDRTGEYWQVFEKERKSPLWYRDISALSPAAQRRFLSGFWQAMETEKASWKTACFPLGNQESALLLYARHTIMDGMSLQVFLNDFCSAGYRELLPDRLLQNRSRLTAEKEEFSPWVRAYYANPDLSVKEKPMSADTGILTQTIRFSREETAQITTRCLKAGITVFTWAQYCLGQALLAMYGTDELWMTHIDSGRGGDGKESLRMIGNLFLSIPVKMRTGLGVRDFQEDLLHLRDCPAVSESRTLFSSGDWRNLIDGFTSGIFQARNPLIRSCRMALKPSLGRMVEMEDGCLVLALSHPDTSEQIAWNRELKKRLEAGLKKNPV